MDKVIEEKAVRQQVAIGEAIGDLWEVATAIPQGSLVITSHIDQLTHGDTVTVENETLYNTRSPTNFLYLVGLLVVVNY